MNCPVCSQEMTPGAKTNLCLNCGHTEPLTAPAEVATVPVVSEPAPVVDEPAAPAPVAPPGIIPPVAPLIEPAVSPEPEPEPAPEPSVAAAPEPAEPVVSVIPTAEAPGEVADTTPAPAAKSSRRKWAVIGGSIAALLVLGASGVYGYATYQMPKTALLGYLDKLVTSKTGQISGSAVYSGDTSDDSLLGLGKTSITLGGSYDVTSQTNPKLDLTVGGTSGTYSVKGNLRTLDKALYFKLSSLGILQDLGITLSNDWYKVPLDDDSTAGKCATASSKNSHSFLGQQLLTNLPLKNTKLVALRDTVSGHPTTHYRGTLDNSKLQGFIDNANKALPAECKLTASASDFDGTVVSYDLWASHNFDRLILRATNAKDKTNVEATIDTSGYNKSVAITAPAGAKALPDLFSGLDTSDAGPALSTNDTRREADMHQIQTNLEVYFSVNGVYPVATGVASTVLAKPLATTLKAIPKDPKNTGAYVYRYTATASDSYQLSVCLDTTDATADDTVAPIAPCTTRTYKLTSLD